MILARVALLESLKVNERVIPCVYEEILPAALPVVRPVLRSTLGQCRSDSFQKFKRDQIEARLSIQSPGDAGKVLTVFCVTHTTRAHYV